MNYAHTPGPWRVAEDHVSILVGDINDPEIVATAAPNDIMAVASRERATALGIPHGADGWDEAKANARLIAAAPELLAALLAILPSHRVAMQNPQAFETSSEVVAACAAIRKATDGGA